uniref:Uncharacterized protein n=1 Tax=viral metagenome TaxID=1070528 RepID=A0A6C0E3I4_9ZZZZ
MTSKNSSQFLSKENLSVLFEVIVDEYKNYILDKNAFNIAFNEMVQMFYYNQIKSGNQTIYDIVGMNKQFISFISLRLEQKFKIQKQQKKPGIDNNNNNNNNNTQSLITNNSTIKSKIKSNNIELQHVTSEDIKNGRLEKFDKELSIKQNEFKNAFNSNIPETPNFKSPVDGPISEMDVLTKQKLEERENEIQNIYNTNNLNINSGMKKEYDFEINESNDWLQYFSSPIEKKETNISSIMKSIKINEELPKQSVVKEEIAIQQNRENDFKSIPKKNISWSDEKGLREDSNFIKIKILEDELPESNSNKSNIFSKLKKIEGRGENQNDFDELTPTPSIVVPSVTDSETIVRLESKIDKLTSEINKCYDVITLLFNTIMSSTNNATKTSE